MCCRDMPFQMEGSCVTLITLMAFKRTLKDRSIVTWQILLIYKCEILRQYELERVVQAD